MAAKVFGHCGPFYERYEENSFNDGLSKYKIMKHCEGSLKRMQTDHIYTGSCNYAAWNIADSCWTAKSMHKQGLACEQSLYNLSNRMLELEVIPACRRFGMGLIIYSLLAGGLLGGVLEKQKEGRRANPQLQANVEARRPQLEAYEALCAELGHSPANVALAWLLHNPMVTAPIIGPRTLDQLKENKPVPEIQFSAETLRKLDEIFPGPGGEAPQAYAW